MVAGSSGPTLLPYPAVLFVALQFPLAWTLSWPNWVLASIALAWLLYRTHLVLRLPIDELVNLLGLEVPSAPSIYLLGVSSDSVALHWKPTEPRHATVKYLVRVNGIQIGGEQPATVTAITLNHLPAGQLYNIRVVAVNSANFQASSDALFVRTLPEPHADSATNHTPDSDSRRQSADAQAARVPTVAVIKGFTEALTPGLSAPSMAREPSSGNLQTKRRASDRRSSPIIHAQDAQKRRISGSEAAASMKEDVKPLTDRLDNLQREIRDIAQQDQAEEEEFEARKNALNAERDSLRAQLREKEEGSKDLKKSVTSLERANTAAQSKKGAQERLLQQKIHERRKMKDDMVRWETEVIDIQRNSEDLVKMKKEHAEKTTLQIEEIRQEQNPDLDRIKELEEQIRERGTHVKELEEVRRGLDDSSPESEPADQHTGGEELAYQQTMRLLQNKYHQAWHELSQAQILYQQTQGRLSMLQSRRGSQSNFMPMASNDYATDFVPAAAGEAPYITQGTPARVPVSNADATHSTFSPAFSRYANAPHNRSTASFNPVPRTASPFFNASNLAPSQPARPFENMSPSEMESLTGGALASPGASMLLPSDLLGDDPYDTGDQRLSPPRRIDSDRSGYSRPSSTAPGPSSYSRPGDSTARAGFLPPLPGLGTVLGTSAMESALSLQPGPSSPTSQHSDSPHSFFASPHGSTSNFHVHKLSEGTVDSDRHSMHSVGSSSQAARPPGRFSNFFSRQRGKTTSEDGPELGTLRPTKTQSMPRSTDWDSSEHPLPPVGQRKGVTGSLLGQVGNSLLGRRERLNNRTSELSISGPLDGRPAHSNIWAFQPMDGSGSRPSSVYSENVLPRPDADNRAFGGWSSTDVLHRSNSTRTGHIPLNPWSSSRRASVQADSASQLQGEPNGLPDEDYGPEGATSPPQAPIGTRPTKKTRAPPPTSLNPAARDFRSIFKKKGRPAATDDEAAEEAFRTSQDITRSSSAGESVEDAASMRGGDSSVPSTPAETPSTPQPNSANRDSFMRKMARKGSSTKFNLGSISGREKSTSSTASSFFSRRSAPAPVDTDGANVTADDDGGSATLGRSLESLPGTPLTNETTSKESKRGSTFSLSSFSKSKKGKKLNAPSISETSMTSASAGAATDDDEGILSERVSVDDFADR